MNAGGTWTRAFVYGATLILTPILLRALMRAFPARHRSPAEYEALRQRYRGTETWSAVCAVTAAWVAIAALLIARVGNTPWLVGVVLGWVVLALLAFIAARTLPRGFDEWREFWKFHEAHHQISLRLLGPLYGLLSALGIISTVAIVSRQ